MSLWRVRFITAFIVLTVTITISFFVNAETRVLAITNTTFIVGLFALMISTILYISVKWAFRVFRYGFGERLREDRPHSRTANASIDSAIDIRSFSSEDERIEKEKAHYNYGVDYEIDPEVLRERRQYEIKKKNREKQIYAIPFTIAAVLLSVSVLFNILYYL